MVRARHRQAGRRAVSRRRSPGASPAPGGLRAGVAEAPRDEDVLPRRGGGERRRSGARGARRGGTADPDRDVRRLRPPVRHPPPGRRPDDVLRGVTPVAAIFVPQELRDAVSDRAWVQAMLDAERALAQACAAVSLVPAEAAARIAAECRVELYDVELLAEEGRTVGNPAEPLVRRLRAAVGDAAADYVHFGATSQDIVDTAAMLVSRRAGTLVLADLGRLSDRCAELARAHRSTPMAARTLLQQAVPTTFGLKAAGWLVSVVEARGRLEDGTEERIGGTVCG